MATSSNRIKAIDKTSVHRITSSQVVVDLQTAVKELVENALDAGATAIDVRIKDNGLKSIEVVDNGSGISPDDYDTVALKHHTSKLTSFEDLSIVETFGFRGEALSSLCALCESVTMSTATESEAPMGTVLEFDRTGRIVSKDAKVARQRGTTVTMNGLFNPLPVRRKEFERHAKREYGKALALLTAYALFPCALDGSGVRFTVSHVSETGKKSVQIQTNGTEGLRKSITALWGTKALDNVVSLDLVLDVEPDSASLRKRGLQERTLKVTMTGLISKFAVGCGRSANDRQYFFVNRRPCNLLKVQKAVSEVYRTFNATQSPFIVVDFSIPTDACDINVSPDKRTIFLHSEQNLIEAIKNALMDHFSDARSTFTLNPNAKLGQSSASTSKGASAQNSSSDQNSSPIVDNLLPTSDPIPMTQPNPFSPPSAESSRVESRPNSAPSPSKDRSAEDPSTSRLEDYFSPSPSPQKASKTRTKSGGNSSTPVRAGKKRPASRSPSPSSNSPRVPRPTKPIQMVLDTTAASWAFNKGGKDTKSSSLPSGSRLVVTNRNRLGKSILSHFRRDSDAGEKSATQETDELPDEEIGTQKKMEKRESYESVPSSGTTSGGRRRSVISIGSSDDDEQPAIPATKTPVIKRKANVEPVRSKKGKPASPDVSVIEVDDSESVDLSRRSKSVMDLTSSKGSPTQTTLDLGDHEESQPKTEFEKTEKVTIKSVSFDLAKVSQVWNSAASRSVSQSVEREEKKKRLADEVEVNDTAREGAEEMLARVIRKEDFASMDILGQFNLGFIIVRSRRLNTTPLDRMDLDEDIKGEEIDDLFIVDQHAADEKYNFETLQQTTKIESQKLLRPRPLDLSASDRLVALENLEILQSNGFEVEVEGDEEVHIVEQLMLVSQPVSKSTVFDMSDLSELLHLMQDQPAGTMVRCSKARTMFASRACRKSVMVGHPMTKAQMTSVVRHMGTMDQPWNCPHGRPTMRHLMRMPPFTPVVDRKVDWENVL